MELVNPDLILPIIGAVIAGGLIGAEREYRASPAGFRTHILVSLSCSLLMLSAVHQIHWLTDTPKELIRIDPVRMAHGILTGIGFLCGGVIFREGFNIRGLTTAASLWSTASLGVLFGIGFYDLAILGTIATVLVLAAASITEGILPQRKFATLNVSFLRKDAPSAENFGEMLKTHGFRIVSVEQRMVEGMISFGTRIDRYTDQRMDSLVKTILDDPKIQQYEVIPHES